jgi:hypothetical protein
MSRRVSGVVENCRDLGIQNHLCWCYTEPGEFRARAVEYLADGVLAGERVIYVAAGDPEVLAGTLRTSPVLARALDSGRALVSDVTAAYSAGAVVDPRAQVDAYAALTAQALDDGCTGLRVAAEVTSLVRTRPQQEAFATYEHLVDQYMARHPFGAMCAYDRTVLGDEVIAELACLHPAASRGATGFWLCGTGRPGCAAAVGGDVDRTDPDRWRRALARADLHPVIGDEILLDAADLAFIDHHGLIALADLAFTRGAPVVLLDGPRSAARTIEILRIPLVTVGGIDV